VRIGLDTSVLLRLLLGEPAGQAATALAFVKESWLAGRRIVVSDLVVSEAYFALHHHYGVEKREAAGRLLEVLRSGLVEPADGPHVLAALEAAGRSPAKPGFVDRLIRAQYDRLSADMATFERAGARLPGTTVLS
jgi:predicted nucleic acid-binding protein